MSQKNIDTPTAASLADEIPSVMFIMDGSGSMHSMGSEPLNGLNNLIKKQKESGDFLFSLVVFDNLPSIVFNNVNGNDIPIMTTFHYDAENGGGTALNDAIGFSINLQKKTKTKNVIVAILTDGLENASSNFNNDQIKLMITEMTEIYKWTFMYLGANQDAFKVGRNLGIKNTAAYCPTGRGCAEIFNTISCQVSRCISGDVTVEDFNPDLSGGITVEEFNGGDIRSSMTVPDLYI